MRKSYWQSMLVDGPRNQQACKSWFAPLVDDDMTVIKADLLCDTATDREKKARIIAKSPDGKRFQFERTLGGKKAFSISRIALDA